MNKDTLNSFSKRVKGEFYKDQLHRLIYATDASAYREVPVGILVAKDVNDVKEAIAFARENKLGIIPRAAGTSLAGQVVGKGLVVDCSKYMNQILELNTKDHWVRIQPGVVLDELNLYLKNFGLFFGPETSTSNRCMVGGMVGNNSCGAHSIVYGSTRDHTLEIKGLLSDGSEVVFNALSHEEFLQKTQIDGLEGEVYRQIAQILSPLEVRQRIENEFPDIEIKRRNTGYAIDLLSRMKPFNDLGPDFNFCSLLCGSEGTLLFITEVKLNLVPLPPAHTGLLVVHHKSIEEALKANLVALAQKPVAIELIDKFLLDCTRNSAEHSKNRFFLEGDPEALLCIEFVADSQRAIVAKSEALISAFKQEGFGYHFPLLFGNDISRVWALRKAGLGLLSNIPGDAKPQPVIEDTAVNPRHLPEYIAEFNKVLAQHNLTCVYYAHIATGELHLRPVLNLKDPEGVRLFRLVATEIARLVKKYRGSLSGEHGDGRLRGEFIPYMIGQENFQLLLDIKQTWDPEGIFNPGKITRTPPMDSSLRFLPGQDTPDFETILDFSDTLGLVRMAEKCNGSADCRKSALIGGTMCPSYQATFDENKTTRARANLLREGLNNPTKLNRFDNEELYEILDMCLSCKACKTECPSGVDMAKLKAEFLYQYYQSNRRPLRMYLIAYFGFSQKLASYIPVFYNYLISNTIWSKGIKKAIGFAKQRSLPKVQRLTWSRWLNKNLDTINQTNSGSNRLVALFVDEFTNYNEAAIGIKATQLLSKLGYSLIYLKHSESGRAKISKGFLKRARGLALKNVTHFLEKLPSQVPLVGIEPSAILSFRDEYPDLLRGEQNKKALELAKRTFTLEEFIASEFEAGRIDANLFTLQETKIFYHGHCQQKAMSGTQAAKQTLSIPKNYHVEEIKSGCCGMAGSFGYEKEHYDLSMKIGELILFPKVRSLIKDEVMAASGTSCRHHIKDGTGKEVFHPVEILWNALKENQT